MAFLKFILLPISALYGIITWIRNLLYDTRIIVAKEFDIKTICVGNLSAGGTGKTPHVDYLISLLKNDMKVATLNRGYGRKSSGYVLANENSTWQEIGDEPCQYKQKHPDVAVAVDASRKNGITQLQKSDNELKLILMDDAFQHRSVKAGLNIVLTDYKNLFINDSMLPSGNLREYKSGIHRADIIIVTKTPVNLPALEKRRIAKDIEAKAYQQVYFSYIVYGALRYFENSKKVDYNKDTNVLMFTGIANNQPMWNYLKLNFKTIESITFGDHHKYTVKDLQKVETLYQSMPAGNTIIVTTEKDYMRLRKQEEFNSFAAQLPMFYLPIEVEFHQPDKEEFNNQIIKYASANKINSNTLEKYR